VTLQIAFIDLAAQSRYIACEIGAAIADDRADLTLAHPSTGGPDKRDFQTLRCAAATSNK